MPRVQPTIFLGCSSEALTIARELQLAFSHDPFTVEIWTDGIFHPSKTPIEDLTALVREIDFAIMVITPDDRTFSRRKRGFSPRDNVIFELGLAIGAIGRARTLMLLPRGEIIKLPSDLLGVTPIDYPPGDDSSLRRRLAPASTEIRSIVKRLGPI
jgi:predicted nucleotide-binding protein